MKKSLWEVECEYDLICNKHPSLNEHNKATFHVATIFDPTTPVYVMQDVVSQIEEYLVPSPKDPSKHVFDRSVVRLKSFKYLPKFIY